MQWNFMSGNCCCIWIVLLVFYLHVFASRRWIYIIIYVRIQLSLLELDYYWICVFFLIVCFFYLTTRLLVDLVSPYAQIEHVWAQTRFKGCRLYLWLLQSPTTRWWLALVESLGLESLESCLYQVSASEAWEAGCFNYIFFASFTNIYITFLCIRQPYQKT